MLGQFSGLREFLTLSYQELELKNLEFKELRTSGKSAEFFQKKVIAYLESERRVKAVTIAFCDLEGKLHMLDYDKKFFLESYENLTFDGSSVRGFTPQSESDLRFKVDWSSFRWLPADIFGSGKVIIFAFVREQDGSQYPSDFRGRLAEYLEELQKKHGYTAYLSPEVEGFLLEGIDAEQNYYSDTGFQLVTKGGYFSALPQDPLRRFIDTVAEVQRSMAFENEKDHGEVGPSQFEINFKYGEVLQICDQILLYKLIARQVAKLMGYTATFLPKPVSGINGSGMHCNMSINSGKKNLFYDRQRTDGISALAEKFLTGILYYAPELCLTINPSVNSYRRLDPHFEAPNEIMRSAKNRGAMIRIPIGNERSARIEVRSVAPDTNPYLGIFSILKAGFSAIEASEKDYKNMLQVALKNPVRKLWGNIYEATASFAGSAFLKKALGDESHAKYLALKEQAAARSPKELGAKIKTGEIIYHHEVTNQMLWNS